TARSGPERPPTRAAVAGTASIMAQRVLPLSDLLVAESFVVAGLAVGLLLDRPGWYGAAAGAAVALLLVVRMGGLTLPRRTARRMGVWNERRRRKRAAH